MNNSDTPSTFTEGDTLTHKTQCPVCEKFVLTINIHKHECFRWKEPTDHESKIKSQVLRPLHTLEAPRKDTQRLEPRGAKFKRMLARELKKAEERKAKRFSFRNFNKITKVVPPNEFYGKKHKKVLNEPV